VSVGGNTCVYRNRLRATSRSRLYPPLSMSPDSMVSPASSESILDRPGSQRLFLAGVAVAAFLVRLLPVLAGGGLGFYGRYDDGVYYTAADALTFGRVPYRDFVLLHPPGILLVLTPFAALGRLTSDPIGMATGRLAFMAVGALNAVLVTVLARRWGRGAAVMAGLMYACWLPAVYGEETTLLEPVGGTALLIALLLLVKTKRPPSARAEVLAGAVLGLACAFKIWYVAPWAVVILWQFLAGRPRAAGRVLVSGVLALLVVLLPFFVLARARMFDMVVRDQLLRPQATAPRLDRLSSIFGIKGVLVAHPDPLIATVIVAVLLAVGAWVCATDPSARILVALLAGNLLVLSASPSYFGHYAALTAAPATLVVAVVAAKLAAAARHRLWAKALYATLLAVLVASGVSVATTAEGHRFPGRQFARAAPAGCVASDDPQALIQMNRLSRDFRSGCRVAVDVTGITYDTLHRVGRNGQPLRRGDNLAFQQYLEHYLLSGTSFVVARRRGDAMPLDVSHRLAQQPRLARADHLALRAANGQP
jgi:alpha-1,2-mannosyltransferase